MRRRILAALAVAVVAGVLAAAPASAGLPAPNYSADVLRAARTWGITPAVQERRIQAGVAQALADTKGKTLSRAAVESSIRKGLRSALDSYVARASRKAPSRTLKIESLWGDNYYYPAGAWNWNGYTWTYGVTYEVESLPGAGCRPMVYLDGYRNGSSIGGFSFLYDRPSLKAAGSGANYEDWNPITPYLRVGNGYLGPAVVDGLYTNTSPGQAMYSRGYNDTYGIGALAPNEPGSYHGPHIGTSHNATLWCH